MRGTVASSAGLLELVRQERPDVVLLDLGLADGFAGPLAASPRAEGVPFVLSTGYPPELLAARHCARRPSSASPTTAWSWCAPWPTSKGRERRPVSSKCGGAV